MLFGAKSRMPRPEEAPPGRPQKMPVPEKHFVLGTPLEPPFPEGLSRAVFGLGCFWGAEKQFWKTKGVYTTAVGYAGGLTPNPTYREVCGGLTGHNEVVLAVFDEKKVTYEELLRVVLGEPRSHPGHAAGQRRGHAVPVGDLHLRGHPGGGRAGLEGSLRARALRRPATGPITTEIARGARVLLRRGLSPAVPGQEPERLLRPGRHRGGMPRGPGHQGGLKRSLRRRSEPGPLGATIRRMLTQPIVLAVATALASGVSSAETVPAGTTPTASRGVDRGGWQQSHPAPRHGRGPQALRRRPHRRPDPAHRPVRGHPRRSRLQARGRSPLRRCQGAPHPARGGGVRRRSRRARGRSSSCFRCPTSPGSSASSRPGQGGRRDRSSPGVGGRRDSAGPDGETRSASGESRGERSATSIQRVDLPKEVQADTQKAVDLIREAMGRQPAPAAMLREVLQGRPEDATVPELLHEPGAFVSGPVRVRARLQRATSGEGLRLEEEGASLALVPEPSAEARLGVAVAWVGQDVEVVGRLRRSAEQTSGARGGSTTSRPGSASAPKPPRPSTGTPVTLPALLAKMAELEGEVVRVVGRFRGRNLFGDLPPRSQKGPNDWVIKSERAAVWITGHKPGGEGWALDLDSPAAKRMARGRGTAARAQRRRVPPSRQGRPRPGPSRRARGAAAPAALEHAHRPPFRGLLPAPRGRAARARRAASSCSSTATWTRRASRIGCGCVRKAEARWRCVSPTTSRAARS